MTNGNSGETRLYAHYLKDSEEVIALYSPLFQQVQIQGALGEREGTLGRREGPSDLPWPFPAARLLDAPFRAAMLHGLRPGTGRRKAGCS